MIGRQKGLETLQRLLNDLTAESATMVLLHATEHEGDPFSPISLAEDEEYVRMRREIQIHAEAIEQIAQDQLPEQTREELLIHLGRIDDGLTNMLMLTADTVFDTVIQLCSSRALAPFLRRLADQLEKAPEAAV